MLLAIDPSLTGFALVSFDREGYQGFIEKSTKTAKTVRDRIARYHQLVDLVDEWISEKNIEYVFIEGYSYASKGRAIVSLAEFGGVLRNFLCSRDVKVVEVAPTMLKKFVTGKGNASKVLVATVLAKKYDMEFMSDNHSDAYGLARLGLAVLGLEEPSSKVKQKIVDTIKETLKETK